MTNPRLLLILLLVLVLVHATVATAKENDATPAFAKQSSLLFIENKGQVTDQHNNPRNDIDAKLQTPGVTIFIGNGQLHYQWVKDTSPQPAPGEREIDFEKGGFDRAAISRFDRQGEISTYRMDVTLVGANTNAELVKEDADDYYENYYTPQAGEKGMVAHAYRKLTYKNIYPNIDWVLYVAAGDKVKYDFIVHPGGTPRDIQIRYDGATELKLHDGALTATTPYGSITENAPYTYRLETRQHVTSSFILNHNILSFSVEKQDEGTLVIDPQLHWATYYGGSGTTAAESVCTDNDSFVYVVGSTSSIQNIATTGSHQSVRGGDLSKNISNGYVAKFNMDGKRIWGTYYYTGATTRFNNSVYNTAIYAYGVCSVSAQALTGAHQSSHGGMDDCVLVKFTTNGTLIWSTYYGGVSDENALGITADNNGDILISGHTGSNNNIATFGTFMPTTVPRAGFLVKFTSNGVRKWGTYIGREYTLSYGVATDKWNNVYVVGNTDDTANIATPGTHKPNFARVQFVTEQPYLIKFDTSGQRIWGTYYGGSTGETRFYGVICDTSGNIYAVGNTYSADSIATSGSFSSTLNGGYDGIFIKFDSSGKRIWGSYYGGLAFDFLRNITYADGHLYVGGYTAGSAGMATADGYLTSYQGGTQDVILAKFSTGGNRVWATYFGGDRQEGAYWGNNVTVTKNKNIFISGSTEGNIDKHTANGHQYYSAGGNTDGFLAKFTDDTLVVINKVLPLHFCVGAQFNMAYRTTYPFRSGNVFSVQLSDATGSFINAVTIGTKAAISTDSILCQIPLSTTPGNGYKIRIIASLKKDTSTESYYTVSINNVYPQNLSANSNSAVCTKDTIRLSSNSSSAGIQYSWTGPGDFTSTLQNPKIANAGAAHAGDYILTGNLYACILKDTVNMSVKPLPYSSAFAASANTPCVADTLRLNISSGMNGTTYTWAGPSSFVSGTQNPEVVGVPPTYAGDYIVTANLDGCIQKDTVTVSLKPLPAKPDATNNGLLCAGANMQFNATSATAGVTWKWAGPNSFTTTIANPFILSAQPIHNGDYIVTATLDGCHARDTVAAVINIIPVKPVITANATLCEKDTLRFNGSTTTTGVTYSWAGPQSFTGSNGDTAFVAASTAASGQYILTVSKDGCSNNETLTVQVNPLPAAVTVSNSGPICEQNNLQLSCGTSTMGSTYSWVGPNSFSSGNQNSSVPTAMPSATGWYKATITLNACSIVDSTRAVVNPIPVLSNTAANQPLCIGQTLNLSTANITNATYSWTGPGGFAANGRTPARANMQPSHAGWYRVVASANGCVSAPDSTQASLNTPPFVVIFTAKDTICQGDAVMFTALPNSHGGTPTYAWKINGTTAGVGSTFSSTAINDGDIISCDMTEYTKCSGPYTDASNDVTMAVSPWLVPSVSIAANPATPVKAGQQITFTATPVNGGAVPLYQWKRNGTNTQGATSAVWSAGTLSDNDEICVEMKSGYRCPQPANVKSNCIKVKILTGIDDNSLLGSLMLYPNPNNGRFVLSGNLLKHTDGTVKLQVLNTLGQVIYKSEVQVAGNSLYKEIELPQVANGTYLLRISSHATNHTIHFNVGN